MSGRFKEIAINLCLLGGITGAATAGASAADLASRLGVAVRTDHAVCLSIPASHLPAQTPVTLVNAGPNPSVTHAEIVAKGSGCPGVIALRMAGYRLRDTRGQPEANAVLIAILGNPRITLRGHAVITDLGETARHLILRTCASADGVHLTAWDGPMPGGVRRWHQYYYLGQDLEPSCTAGESAQ